jgi:hypothetical protein
VEFFIGVLVGFIGCIFWLVMVGVFSYRREIKRLTEQGQVWHPNGKPCTDGHTWCEEHAKQGQFHCTKCPHVMTEE